MVRTTENITGREDLPLSPRWRGTRLRIESLDGKVWKGSMYTIDGVVISGGEWARRKRWVRWPIYGVVGCGVGGLVYGFLGVEGGE